MQAQEEDQYCRRLPAKLEQTREGAGAKPLPPNYKIAKSSHAPVTEDSSSHRGQLHQQDRIYRNTRMRFGKITME